MCCVNYSYYDNNAQWHTCHCYSIDHICIWGQEEMCTRVFRLDHRLKRSCVCVCVFYFPPVNFFSFLSFCFLNHLQTTTVCWFFLQLQHKHSSRTNQRLLKLKCGWNWLHPFVFQISANQSSVCLWRFLLLPGGKHLKACNRRSRDQGSWGHCAVMLCCVEPSCFSLHCSSVTQEAHLLWCQFL